MVIFLPQNWVFPCISRCDFSQQPSGQAAQTSVEQQDGTGSWQHLLCCLLSTSPGGTDPHLLCRCRSGTELRVCQRSPRLCTTQSIHARHLTGGKGWPYRKGGLQICMHHGGWRKKEAQFKFALLWKMFHCFYRKWLLVMLNSKGLSAVCGSFTQILCFASMWHAVRLWKGSGCQMRTGASKIHLSVKFQSHLPDIVLSMQRTLVNYHSLFKIRR